VFSPLQRKSSPPHQQQETAAPAAIRRTHRAQRSSLRTPKVPGVASHAIYQRQRSTATPRHTFLSKMKQDK